MCVGGGGGTKTFLILHFLNLKTTMEEQHAKKYIKTDDDASRKKLCEAIDRGSILN